MRCDEIHIKQTFLFRCLRGICLAFLRFLSLFVRPSGNMACHSWFFFRLLYHSQHKEGTSFCNLQGRIESLTCTDFSKRGLLESSVI